jgi:hypothetical protein
MVNYFSEHISPCNDYEVEVKLKTDLSLENIFYLCNGNEIEKLRLTEQNLDGTTNGTITAIKLLYENHNALESIRLGMGLGYTHVTDNLLRLIGLCLLIISYHSFHCSSTDDDEIDASDVSTVSIPALIERCLLVCNIYTIF